MSPLQRKDAFAAQPMFLATEEYNEGRCRKPRRYKSPVSWTFLKFAKLCFFKLAKLYASPLR
jgi:hypothetical protein